MRYILTTFLTMGCTFLQASSIESLLNPVEETRENSNNNSISIPSLLNPKDTNPKSFHDDTSPQVEMTASTSRKKRPLEDSQSEMHELNEIVQEKLKKIRTSINKSKSNRARYRPYLINEIKHLAGYSPEKRAALNEFSTHQLKILRGTLMSSSFTDLWNDLKGKYQLNMIESTIVQLNDRDLLPETTLMRFDSVLSSKLFRKLITASIEKITPREDFDAVVFNYDALDQTRLRIIYKIRKDGVLTNADWRELGYESAQGKLWILSDLESKRFLTDKEVDENKASIQESDGVSTETKSYFFY